MAPTQMLLDTKKQNSLWMKKIISWEAEEHEFEINMKRPNCKMFGCENLADFIVNDKIYYCSSCYLKHKNSAENSVDNHKK